MIEARIYCPAKSAMQSGRASYGAGGSEHRWLLEFLPGDAKRPDALMGWAGSGDMRQQVRLRFASAEDAAAYAERNGIAYRIEKEQKRRVRPKSYSEIFR